MSSEAKKDHDLDHWSWTKCIMGCAINKNMDVIALQCFHFICSEDCVKKLPEGLGPGSKRCKKCSSVVLPTDLLNRINTNYFSRINESVADVKLFCEICIFSREAIAYCKDCSSLLCHECCKMHPQFRASVSHVIQEDISEQREKQFKINKESLSKCQLHEKEYACYCETCDIDFCEVCQKLHDGHKKIDLNQHKLKLETQVEKARNVVGTLGDVVLQIRNKRKNMLETEWKFITGHIVNLFSDIFARLSKRRQELLEIAGQNFRTQLTILRKREYVGEIFSSSSSRFISFAKTMSAEGFNGSDVKALRMYQRYAGSLDRLNEDLTTKFDFVIGRNCHFQFNRNNHSKMIELLSKFGSVEYVNSLAALDCSGFSVNNDENSTTSSPNSLDICMQNDNKIQQSEKNTVEILNCDEEKTMHINSILNTNVKADDKIEDLILANGSQHSDSVISKPQILGNSTRHLTVSERLPVNFNNLLGEIELPQTEGSDVPDDDALIDSNGIQNNSPLETQNLNYIGFNGKFSCLKCDKSFAIVSKLLFHIKIAHGVDDSIFRIGCKSCGAIFLSRKEHMNHRRTVHGSKYNSKKPSDVSKSKQPCHILSGEDPKHFRAKYKCTCGIIYYNRASFQIHCRTKNLGKQFFCKICQKGFDIHGNLKNHVLSVHKVEYKGKPFACLQCSQCFDSRTLLAKHQVNNCTIK